MSSKSDERMGRNDREASPRDSESLGSQATTTLEREQPQHLSDPARRAQFRAQWNDSYLPGLPPKAGFHRCWVSTTHPIDTPQRRQRNGYRFVSLDEVKTEGWSAEANSVKDGVMAGAVMWREMVAMECTTENYELYMQEFHFNQPREQALGIFDGLDGLAAEAKDRGGRITLEEGMNDLRERVQTPRRNMFDLG
jgi:hypothetical protein